VASLFPRPARPAYPPKNRTLALYRKALGLTQGALCRRMTLSQPWIAELEARPRFRWTKDVHRKQFDHYLNACDLAANRVEREALAALEDLARVEAGEPARFTDGRQTPGSVR
jgi:transcriptional regulator with XRE-family HTH domain